MPFQPVANWANIHGPLHVNAILGVRQAKNNFFCTSLPSLFKATRTLAASFKSLEMRISSVVFIVGKFDREVSKQCQFWTLEQTCLKHYSSVVELEHKNLRIPLEHKGPKDRNSVCWLHGTVRWRLRITKQYLVWKNMDWISRGGTKCLVWKTYNTEQKQNKNFSEKIYIIQISRVFLLTTFKYK